MLRGADTQHRGAGTERAGPLAHGNFGAMLAEEAEELPPLGEAAAHDVAVAQHLGAERDHLARAEVEAPVYLIHRAVDLGARKMRVADGAHLHPGLVHQALGIAIHGTFILGLPGETRETIEETIRFACDIDPDTIQVSLAAPYPGTALYDEARRNGWMEAERLVDEAGVQVSAIS